MAVPWESQSVVAREPGCEATLRLALEELRRTTIDARAAVSTMELLQHAADGKLVAGPTEVAVGVAANAAPLQAGTRLLKEAAAAADRQLHSLLCRQLFDRAMSLEKARLAAEADAFKEAVVKVFQLADDDGSGRLEYGEVRGIALSEPEAAAILQTLVANKDGHISKQEFTALAF